MKPIFKIKSPGYQFEPLRLWATPVIFLTSLNVWAADLNFSPSNLNPAPTIDSWAVVNRTYSLAIGGFRQNYREFDPAGVVPNGIFDSEKGTVKTGAFEARRAGWVGTVPFWAQFNISRSTGQTTYQGYLQNHNVLVPYNGSTGNAITEAKLRLGFPQAISSAVQIIPFAGFGINHWQRQLGSYGETYRHQEIEAGALVQWRPIDRWLLEADGALGRTRKANLSVPQFGFDQALGSDNTHRYGAAATYQFNKQFSGGVHWQYEGFRYGQSAIADGFQEPDSRTSRQTLLFQVNYRY